ncbi:MAG TPA: STAS domain-containing protein [Pseudonocardiaceae bacterium]|nr:STAS domain-containing protein [Pseudonocardiaceae bacterium]
MASTMCDTPISVMKDQGSAGCLGAEALHVVIDQPIAGVRVVQVAGELDMQTAPQLDSRLLSQIDVRVRHVVVDLSKVTFLGAAGLESLVRAREAATCHHIKLHLTGVDHRAVTLPLEITGLLPAFSIRPFAESVIVRVGGPVQLTASGATKASQ